MTFPGKTYIKILQKQKSMFFFFFLLLSNKNKTKKLTEMLFWIWNKKKEVNNERQDEMGEAEMWQSQKLKMTDKLQEKFDPRSCDIECILK